MKEIAEKLQAAGTIRIPKIEINDDITKMAESIFNRGADSRTQEEVFRDCKRIAIEFALVKVLGGERNPKEFNFKDKDSYIWDVMVDGKKFEVKRHKSGAKYFTYSSKKISTYIKNCMAIDYLVTAYMDESSDNYIIDFAMIADSKKFEFYFQQSKYNNSYYYDHRIASNVGDCIAFGLREATFY